MAVTPKRLIAGAALTTSWSNALYNVPTTALSATAKQLIVCNQDTVPRTFFYAVTPNSTNPVANSPYVLFYSVTLQANETKVFGLTDVMAQGYYIQAKTGEADTTRTVNITVSGMENT